MAEQGTIFMDEIGEMTMRMQGLLLRFMETGELQKVGGDRTDGRVDVRVIAATNRNLREMVVQGTFREDLFYRLNVIHLTVPPLRDRREDIPELIGYFVERFTRTNGYIVKSVGPDAVKMLTEYSWPGNVRELENVIERCVVTGRNEMISVDDLPMEVRMHANIGLRPSASAGDGNRRSVPRLLKDANHSGASLSALHAARDPRAMSATW